MQELFQRLLADLEQGRIVAYCRLVETRGSTPQKAGALMLVYPDGSQSGTLGGGCVEAEVKRRALSLLANHQPEICSFQLDSDYGWDDGLICGGRMKILVEPIGPGLHKAVEYFRALATRGAQGQGMTEAIVFDSAASGLAAPLSVLFDDADKVLATLHVPGGSTDIGVRIDTDLKSLQLRPRSYAAHGIAYLPSLPRCRLVIVGGGHVGQAVANLAADLDFDIWVVDDREDVVSQERFPRATRRISGRMEQTLKSLEIDANTYCLIVTRGHNHDQEALFHLIQHGARYVGLIGSRRKIRLIFDNLEQAGVPRAALEKVYAPLGIDIGSQTVPEIAISICAELIAHRNTGEVPGRAQNSSAISRA